MTTPSRGAPVGCWWDIDSAPPPSGLHHRTVLENIKSFALKELGSVSRVVLVGNLKGMDAHAQGALRKLGVHVFDTRGRDAGDKALVMDILFFALDHQPPATVLLCTGNRTLAPLLKKLRQRDYRVAVGVPHSSPEGGATEEKKSQRSATALMCAVSEACTSNWRELAMYGAAQRARLPSVQGVCAAAESRAPGVEPEPAQLVAKPRSVSLVHATLGRSRASAPPSSSGSVSSTDFLRDLDAALASDPDSDGEDGYVESIELLKMREEALDSVGGEGGARGGGQAQGDEGDDGRWLGLIDTFAAMRKATPGRAPMAPHPGGLLEPHAPGARRSFSAPSQEDGGYDAGRSALEREGRLGGLDAGEAGRKVAEAIREAEAELLHPHGQTGFQFKLVA